MRAWAVGDLVMALMGPGGGYRVAEQAVLASKQTAHGHNHALFGVLNVNKSWEDYMMTAYTPRKDVNYAQRIASWQMVTGLISST